MKMKSIILLLNIGRVIINVVCTSCHVGFYVISCSVLSRGRWAQVHQKKNLRYGLVSFGVHASLWQTARELLALRLPSEYVMIPFTPQL